MGMTLNPFYPIVPDVLGVQLMLKAGASLIQLRIKDAPELVVIEQARRALTLCKAAGAELVINDHWHVALDIGAAAVHLGQDDLRNADLAALRRSGVRIGVSTHDEAELERALFIDPDYVALGPIWPTTLKVMPWGPQGVERLALWKRHVGALPLVAIGGITLARIGPCLHGGADVVAVVNDVINATDPVFRARQWIEAVRRHS